MKSICGNIVSQVIHKAVIKEDQQDHSRTGNKEPYSHEDQTLSKQWKSYGSTWKWDTSEEGDTTAMWQDVGIQQSVAQQDASGEDEECVYENTITTALNNQEFEKVWEWLYDP